MSHGLTLRREGDTVFISFSKPAVANAFGPDDAEELIRLLKKNKTAARLIWRAPNARVFCAGGDLAHYAGLKNRARGLVSNAKIRRALEELASFSGRTLAVIEGDCFGGGLEVLSAFDETWATPQTAFGLWQRRIGLSFGWGGYRRLLKRVPEQILKRHALDTGIFSVHEARAIGLVDRVVVASQIGSEIERFISRDRTLPQGPRMILKELAPKIETAMFNRLWGKPDHVRVLAEFKKKNK